MKYGTIDSFQAGVAIPLFSLRSEEGCGVGEFNDLLPFAQWCKKCDLDLIQLLPVNDTGEESSPYGAKSAFALNPIFLHLDSIEGVSKYTALLKKKKKYFNDSERVLYSELYRFKMEILKKVYTDQSSIVAGDTQFHKWIESNSWVRTYCAYSVLKEKNSKKSWQEWGDEKNPTIKMIDTLWEKEWEEVLFYAWVQFIAEDQFLKVVQSLDAIGVKIKGDIPILINEDSADVWGMRKFFDLSMRAGAPPDMFSYTGQNWGFPCYKWETIEKDDFSWWKMRLAQSAKFFHAIRIDHVLGFFRIWQTQESEQSGMLGVFNPYKPITIDTLQGMGFSDQTIRYLTHPVYSKEYICDLMGEYCGEAISRYFSEIEPGEFKLGESVDSEKKINSLNESSEVKDILRTIYWNRVFISHTEGEYYPFWYYYDAPVFTGLPDHEQKVLGDLINHNNGIQEEIWEHFGRKLLGMMAQETDMLVCAEDLGVVPNCVGKVLQELGMLSLKIERWARDYHADGAPFINPSHYPRLSVCSPSCHDSSTLRGYWEEEWDRENYYPLLNNEGECPTELTSALARKIIERNLNSNSLLTIIPFQDYMALDGSMIKDENPDDERINIPGTMDETNWTWRMDKSIEELLKSKTYNKLLKDVISIRKNKSIDL
ncbi:MAG: 4-alpha-glucanotransferase [Fibrobacterales bacterium]